MPSIDISSVSPRVRDILGKTAGRRRTLLTFELGGQIYGIDLDKIQEIVPMAQLFRPASLPMMIAGFLNLAGSAVPVLRLDRLFGLAEFSIGLYTPLVILHHPDAHLAVIVERVHRIIIVSAESILPIPENHTFNDCVEGTAMHAEQAILLLSPERILLEKEQLCVAEFESREQARLRDLEEPIP
jgi:purine-binding chemotaxis protein CheW